MYYLELLYLKDIFDLFMCFLQIMKNVFIVDLYYSTPKEIIALAKEECLQGFKKQLRSHYIH